MRPTPDSERVLFTVPPRDVADGEESQLLTPRFDDRGLVTAVVTDAATGLLLMVAHMDQTALDLTIRTGIAHYFSRSRNALWKKGETSGALQTVKEMWVDCDQDALWLRVDVPRPQDTCHTHRETCFYRRIDRDGTGRQLILDQLPQQRA